MFGSLYFYSGFRRPRTNACVLPVLGKREDRAQKKDGPSYGDHGWDTASARISSTSSIGGMYYKMYGVIGQALKLAGYGLEDLLARLSLIHPLLLRTGWSKISSASISITPAHRVLSI